MIPRAIARGLIGGSSMFLMYAGYRMMEKFQYNNEDYTMAGIAVMLLGAAALVKGIWYKA